MYKTSKSVVLLPNFSMNCFLFLKACAKVQQKSTLVKCFFEKN